MGYDYRGQGGDTRLKFFTETPEIDTNMWDFNPSLCLITKPVRGEFVNLDFLSWLIFYSGVNNRDQRQGG